MCSQVNLSFLNVAQVINGKDRKFFSERGPKVLTEIILNKGRIRLNVT